MVSVGLFKSNLMLIVFRSFSYTCVCGSAWWSLYFTHAFCEWYSCWVSGWSCMKWPTISYVFFWWWCSMVQSWFWHIVLHCWCSLANVSLGFFSCACIGKCWWYTLVFWLGSRVHCYTGIHLPHRHWKFPAWSWCCCFCCWRCFWVF